MPRARPWRNSIWWIAGGIWLMTAWFFPYFPTLGSPNELSRLYVTRAILDDGTFSIDGPVKRFGPLTDMARANDRLYSDKAPGVALLGVPVYALMVAVHGGDAGAVSNDSLLRWMRIFLSGLPTALLVVLLFNILGQLQIDRGWRLFLCMAYGLGTVAFPYGVLLFGHQLSALCLFGAFGQAERQSRSPDRIAPLATGLLLGTSLLVEYTTVLLVLPLAIYTVVVSPRRQRDCLLGVAGALLPLLLLVFYQVSAFGSPFGTGYSHLVSPTYAEVHGRGLLGMTAPSLSRLATILFSPDKGLWFYSPWLVLALIGIPWTCARPATPRWRPAWIAIACGSAAYLLFSSSLDLAAWGWSLGPRHLAPLVPFLVLAIGALLAAPPPWPRWTGRALRMLAPVSVLLTVLPTVVFGGFPPDFSNPLADFTAPLLLSGCVSPNALSALGLPAIIGGLPLLLILLAILGWMVAQGPGSGFGKAFSACLSLAILALVFGWTGPPDPREDAALRWVERDIMHCPDSPGTAPGTVLPPPAGDKGGVDPGPAS